MRRRAAGWALVALVAGVVRAGAQSPDRAIDFDDFGFVRPVHASVRGSAWSAYSAVANDASALAYNPAGLAGIRRISAIASFLGAHSIFEQGYDGVAQSEDADAYALAFVGAAYPLPVLRGSLVPAIGVQRLFSSSLDIAYSGYNAPDERDERFALQQSGSTYAYQVGFGIDLSAGFSAGANFLLLDGSIDRVRQYDTRGRVVDPNVHTFVYQRAEADVGGVGARVGLLFYALRRIRIGVTWTTPLAMKVSADVLTEETRQVDNDVGTFTSTSSSTSSEYQTPSAYEGALAVAASPSLTLSVQAAYSDWSQATIDDKRVIRSNLESVLRSVLDVRVGAEWTSSHWPLRVRAGYARARGALAFLEADRIDNDRLEPIEDETHSERYSLGAGWLLRDAIVVDAAVSHARGSRASATIDDDREATTFSIGCGYWF